MKISGVVKSAEEITGIENIQGFEGERNGRSFTYSRYMNTLADKRIELENYKGDYGYDYTGFIEGACFKWQSGWLKDIREEKDPVDWSKVPIDAKVKITIMDNFEEKRYFARYDKGKVYIWYGGKTSWTARGENDTSFWSPDQVELVED